MSSDVSVDDAATPDLTRDRPPIWYDLLRHPHRLYTLEILQSAGSLSVTALTSKLHARVSASETGTPPTRTAIRLSLVHNHLPRLADGGMLVWTDETVTLVATVPQAATAVTRHLETRGQTDEQLLETVFHPARMAILGLLYTQETVSFEAAVDALLDHDHCTLEEQSNAEIALHHSHLPALAAVGVISYETETETIRLVADQAPVVSY